MNIYIYILYFIIIYIINYIKCDRITDAMIEYQFTRDECLNKLYNDDSNNDLLGGFVSTSKVNCIQGNGIQVDEGIITDEPIFYSNNDAETMIKYMLNKKVSGISFEFWFTPKKNRATLFNLGAEITHKSDPTCSEYYDMNIIQNDKTIGIEWENLENCESRDVDDLISYNTPQHLVVTLEDYACFYVNGNQDCLTIPIFSNLTDLSLPYWNTTYIAELFSDASEREEGDDLWAGTLYLFSIYDYVLDQSDVTANYEAKLPNSDPVTNDMNITMKEDGEVGNHYSSPIYYQNKINKFDLYNISLDAYDIDDDITYPNYDVSNTPMIIYIDSLPTNVTLYQYDTGNNINIGDTLTDSDYRIYFRPSKNANNDNFGLTPFTSFTYHAEDGETGEISDTSTIKINVEAVNDPPIPSETVLTAYAGVLTKLTFTASDVEDNEIDNAYITEIPSNVSIYYILDTSPLTYNNTPVDSNDFPISLDGVSFGLLYTGPQLADDLNDDGIITTVSISYKVIEETTNVESTIVDIDIDILTPLEAIPSNEYRPLKSSRYTVDEDTDEIDAKIALFSDDLSDDRRILQYVISTLPSHGILKDSFTNEILEVGSVLYNVSYPPESSNDDYDPVYVLYIPDENYFNTPKEYWNNSKINNINDDEFNYYIHVNNKPKLKSSVVTQTLTITNVNDPANITSIGDVSYAIKGLETIYIEDKFVVTDEDHDVDIIRCDIVATSSTARVTLSNEALELADFQSDICFGSSEWTCKSSGQSTKRMVFLALPSDLNIILNNMTYINTDTDLTDIITITLYDGMDGNCISEESFDNEDKTTSVRDSCTSSSSSFTVELSGLANIGEAVNTSTDYRILGAIGGGIVVSCCICFRLMCCWSDKRAKKRFEKKYGKDALEEREKGQLDGFARDPTAKFKNKKATNTPKIKKKKQVELKHKDEEMGNMKMDVNPMLKKDPSLRNKFNTPIADSSIPPPPIDPETDPKNWQKFRNENNQLYFFNKKTRRTTWTAPQFAQLNLKT